ncbi:YceI family protein [Snodgrassella gandavensis]|uniref:YceI family protein n=1 Tax=Snodgrassella gandavensis TaxID=2946698 RepID=UPI001EF467B1|nr:YceI family protein [Snodgrassella gandavensis]
MNRLAGILMATLLGIAVPAMAANYKIDPLHTNARFTLDHFATSSNVGGFYNLNGELQYDAGAKTGAVDITIPLSTLDTGRSEFTKHLQSKPFFNVAQYPIMHFVSHNWSFDKEGKVRALRGQLTMVGQTHPVTLRATKFNCYKSPMNQSQVCGGDFEAVIDRSQWGINEYLTAMPASRYVKLNIQIEAIKQ